MFLNGVLWTPDYPKTLTLDEAKALVQQNIATSLSCKLTTIADVICDVPVRLFKIFLLISVNESEIARMCAYVPAISIGWHRADDACNDHRSALLYLRSYHRGRKSEVRWFELSSLLTSFDLYLQWAASNIRLAKYACKRITWQGLMMHNLYCISTRIVHTPPVYRWWP